MEQHGGYGEARYLQVGFDLRGRRCLVVGGGEVGRRRAEQLKAAGALVKLVAPDGEAAEGVETVPRAFDEDDLEGCLLVVVATDDPQVNALVAEEARRRGVLVAVVDDAGRSDLIMPAVLRRGPVTVAVSTGGASPVLAAFLRDQIAGLIGPEWGVLAALLGELRAVWRPSGLLQPERAAAWRRILDLRLDRLIAEGKLKEAHALAEAVLVEAENRST